MRVFFAAFIAALALLAGIVNAACLDGRLRRDVNSLSGANPLAYDYLLPQQQLDIAAAQNVQLKHKPAPKSLEQEAVEATTPEAAQESSEAPQESAALRENGYEYRTVRRLKYRLRSRRDVSHLSRDYLPPVAPPSLEYLPPIAPPAPTPVPDVEEVAPKISNEYLPPLADEEQDEEQLAEEPEEQAPEQQKEPESVSVPPTELQSPIKDVEQSEEPVALKISNEYLPPDTLAAVLEMSNTTEQPTTEAALEANEEEMQEHEEQHEEDEAGALVESAVLDADGYHYRRPTEVANLAPVPESLVREYLPPLEEGVVEATGPGEESAVLAEDGYHYRAIKRVRF